MIPIIGLEESTGFEVVRLSTHTCDIRSGKHSFDRWHKRRRAAPDICIEPSCKDASFDVCRRLQAEAADIVAVLAPEVHLIFFLGVLTGAVEALLRKIAICRTEIPK